MTKAPEDLLRALRGGERFLLTSHANPDGDAIGSEVGLARILRSMGKGVAIWNADPTPRVYQSLPGSDRIHHGDEPPAGFPDAFDALITVECPTLDRSGLEAQLADALPILNIDHHLGNEHYGQVNWVDTAAPSLGEMIHRLARALNVPLDVRTANALYLTLVTDTGGFRFANATAAAFTAAAELVREGARPDATAELLYERRSEGSMRLLGEMLGSLRLHADGRLATVLLTAPMFERSGASRADTEGLIDFPRSIGGVQAVALVREVEPPTHKISLRSRGQLDVQELARQHGGGGHRNAAGFTRDGEAEAIRDWVVAQLEPALAE